MKLHTNGTLEGSPEEIAQYQRIQAEQRHRDAVDNLMKQGTTLSMPYWMMVNAE